MFSKLLSKLLSKLFPTTPKHNHKYGWKKDKLDKRDKKFSMIHKLTELPPSKNLSTNDAPIYNQENLGSCTAQAIAGIHQFEQIKINKDKAFIPSRLMIYFEEREMEGTINSDEGAMIRDGMKCVANQGVCPETMWPYNIKQFAVKPTPDCYTEAMNHQITQYLSLDNDIDQLKGCLAEGFPFVCGILIFSSFESNNVTKTGIVPMPGCFDRRMGGHAIMCIGYDDSTKRFLCRNSWGCYSDDTEVLTERGWLLFKDTTDEDMFFTLNAETNKIEINKRSQYFEYPFDGELYRFSSTKIDLLVTPNHTMYLKTNAEKNNKENFKFIKAEDITDSSRYWFKRCGKWDGIEKKIFSLPPYSHNDGKNFIEIPPMDLNMDDWLEFFGYWISEGSLSLSKCKRGGNEYNVQISQTKPQIKELIYSCCCRLGFNTHKTKTSINISNKQLYLYLKQFGKCDSKYISSEIKQLSSRQLKILFDALMRGDGSISQANNKSYRFTYFTSSKLLMSDVQEICLKMGLATTVKIDDRIGTFNSKGFRYNFLSYQIRIHGLQSRDADKTMVTKSGLKKEPYLGMVYCVEVPNHLLYIKRNGKSCWCGNSEWGQAGYFEIPYDYFADPNLSSDFWTIRLIEVE